MYTLWFGAFFADMRVILNRILLLHAYFKNVLGRLLMLTSPESTSASSGRHTRVTSTLQTTCPSHSMVESRSNHSQIAIKSQSNQ